MIKTKEIIQAEKELSLALEEARQTISKMKAMNSALEPSKLDVLSYYRLEVKAVNDAYNATKLSQTIDIHVVRKVFQCIIADKYLLDFPFLFDSEFSSRKFPAYQAKLLKDFKKC